MTDGNRFNALGLAQQRIPDFYVSKLPDGGYQAIARYEITDELAEYGCRAVLLSDRLGEIEILCAAERIKRSAILAAKRLANTPEEDEHNRHLFALDEEWSRPDGGPAS